MRVQVEMSWVHLRVEVVGWKEGAGRWGRGVKDSSNLGATLLSLQSREKVSLEMMMKGIP